MSKPRHPFTALPDNLFGILVGYEWAVMMALAHHGYSSYPSQKRIAELAGISLTTAQKTLNSLKEKGLVDWESRKRPDGGQGSNLYRLTIDDLWNPSGGVPATRVPPTRDTGTPHPRGTDQEQDLLEPDLLEQLEPPLPPAAKAESPEKKEPDRIARIKQKTISVYNTHKPDNWASKRLITSETEKLMLHWLGELGEEEFYKHLEATLKYCKQDKWWADKTHNLTTILRKEKGHIVQLAEKYEVTKSKPHLSRGYSSDAADRPGPGLRKLTDYSYATSDDLF